jgi:putative peptidoglycan lipid II flippase
VPDVVEPGTRLVQRYRLEEHLGALEQALGGADGIVYWRAVDELLDRPVGVCLLPADDPRAPDVLRAARLAAAVGDSRFLRVLDASEVDGAVYVVSEWVSATSLVDLLADGPLAPQEAQELAVDLAGALSAAHDQGLSHLCLQPEHVLRTTHGQVKIAGLGVDAAARGVAPAGAEDAARRDTEGVASVLYAALTARWPGGDGTHLVPAPHDGSEVCTPRQVRAGIPDDLDDAVCRALGLPGRRHGADPLRTPGDLRAALSAAHVTSRIPVVRSAGPRPRETEYPAPHVSPYARAPKGRRPLAATLAWVAAGLVLVVGLVLFGGQLLVAGLGGDDATGSTPGDDPTGQQSEDPGGLSILKVAGATTLDPPPGDGEENSDRAPLAVDDDPATAWPTKTYNDPFGPTGLKFGVGLLLDLGSQQDVSRVAITVLGGATDLELRVADDAGDAGDALDDYRLVDEASDVDGQAVLRPEEAVSARYVLVWLTQIPARDGTYRGEVADVTISG